YNQLRQGKHTAACLAVTSAGLLKLFPFVLLPWFVWRGGRGARSRAIIMLTVLIVLAAGATPGMWWDYFKHSPSFLAEMVNRVWNFSIPSLVTRVGYLASDTSQGFPQAASYILCGQLIGAAIILAAYAICLCGSTDMESEFCLL